MAKSLGKSESSELEDFVEKNIPTIKASFDSKPCSFADFRLSNQILDNIRLAQFENPSPVQALALPKALMRQDILCQAKSGTGKTAVFVLSVIQLFIEQNLRFLVIANTKEMAHQIKKEFARFSKAIDIRVGDTLECDVIVDTPESIIPILERVDNSSIQGIVVDECDFLMLDNKMQRELSLIFEKINTKKQVMMFTATLTKSTKAECMKFLDNPFLIFVDDDSKLTLHGLKQYYIETKERNKLDVLSRLASRYSRIIVFSKYVQNALYIEANMKEAKAVTPMMDTGERLKILEEFKEKDFRILCTTDILSRGIDIQNLECVVNYDIPSDPQTYLHRVGRAGRFETEGYAISFANGKVDGIRMNEIMDRYEIDIEQMEFQQKRFSS